MTAKAKTLTDLRDLETRRARGWGFELKCQRCGEWKRKLLVVKGGKQVCEKCARAIK